MSNNHVTLEDGAGGRESALLVQTIFRSRFGGTEDGFADAARKPFPGGQLLMSTDGFVVQPAEFPGGNIGKLAVCGTVNDIAVSGGRPLYLAAGYIIEEGFPLQALERIAEAMATTAHECGVSIVTGDTKVVPRGQADGVYIHTTGVGTPVCEPLPPGPVALENGDVLIASGNLGEHGLALLAFREGLLDPDSNLQSDCAPVHRATAQLQITLGTDLRLMRDPTRGGLATTLWEIVHGRDFNFLIEEADLPYNQNFYSLAAMLGLDLLHLPSEGRFIAIVKNTRVDDAVQCLRQSGCPDARVIGRISKERPGRTVLITSIGGQRFLEPLAQEQLPRIC